MTESDLCLEYFYTNGDTGEIMLKKLLQDDAINRFEVRMLLTSQGMFWHYYNCGFVTANDHVWK